MNLNLTKAYSKMLIQPAEPEKVAGKFDQQPLWRLAFRPFYLLAAAFAAIAIPLWLLGYNGALPALPNVNLNWHMHEMIFGFVLAVVVAFLFTAGRNWTGLWTPRGATLAAFCALWLAGRLAMLCAPAPVAALVDILFLPCAAWSFFKVLKKAKNYKNMFAVGLLLLLTVLNGLFHAAGLGYVGLAQTTLMQAALLIVVVIVTIIGGRVMPMFTRNGAGSAPRVNRKLDWSALALLVLAGLSWLFGAWAPLTALLAALAGAAHLARLIGWQPQSTVKHPLLWILHLAYGWIGVGLLLLAAAALGLATASSAFHALAVGAISGMIVGMITRTALGHTGRELKAGPGETAMYALIQLGAALRLLANLVGGDARQAALIASGACWSGAFLLYLWVYAPYLSRARIDGREG
jgi:uncharacterized protein involved in response to NO